MKKKSNDLSSLGGLMYSTDPDWQPEEAASEDETPSVNKQDLRVQLDKKKRGGKSVTLVTGFVGAEKELQDLGKLLKSKCGVGGTAKEGEILIQGDFREKVMELLEKEGYKVKKIGG